MLSLPPRLARFTSSRRSSLPSSSPFTFSLPKGPGPANPGPATPHWPAHRPSLPHAHSSPPSEALRAVAAGYLPPPRLQLLLAGEQCGAHTAEQGGQGDSAREAGKPADGESREVWAGSSRSAQACRPSHIGRPLRIGLHRDGEMRGAGTQKSSRPEGTPARSAGCPCILPSPASLTEVGAWAWGVCPAYWKLDSSIMTLP